MTKPHILLGVEAEESVVTYLTKNHPDLKIIARNVRFKCGEIDIIYERTLRSGVRELVFVEVKASHESLEMALWNFTPQKRLKMSRAVQLYLARYKGSASEVRLELALTAQNKEIRIIQI